MSSAPSPAPLPSAPAKPAAVIDIGTTSVRMAIAEIGAEGQVRLLENLSQAANLGKDTRRLVSREIDKDLSQKSDKEILEYVRAR